MYLKSHENNLRKSVDSASMAIAKRFGFSYVPWYNLTIFVLAIYSTLTCFVLFYRSDFLNLTICTVGVYMMLNTESIRKWTFRLLVFAIVISMIYDLVWFFIQDLGVEHPDDGGLEKKVRSFSLNVSYVSFFFRVTFNF